MDFDEILPLLGEFGRYQKLMILLVLLPGIVPCGFNAYSQLFMASDVNHFCKIPELEYLLPDQSELYKNVSIPREALDNNLHYSKCKMYNVNYSELVQNGLQKYIQEDNFNTTETINCKNGWIFEKNPGEISIISEWNLVCDKKIYPTLALVILGAGSLVGNFVFGYVQDSLGRKPAFFIYLTIMCIFGVATAFANNFTIWILCRIGVGFTIPAIMATPMLLALEIVGTKYRTTVNILSNIMYSLSLIFLAGVVYTFRDWRTVALSTSVPFIFYFLYWFVMPESPRWLLNQRKLQEMNRVMKTMARINGKSSSEFESYTSNFSQETTIRSYGALDLIRTPNLRIKTIIITFIWFTNTSVYVGLSYYAPALGGNKYLNFFLAGVVELPTYLFLWPSMEKWGRRWILCLSMIIGGSACLATFLAKNDSVVTLGLYCVGKMGISSSFVVVLLITSELYPTVIRGLGMGICTVFGGLGPIIIPLINYLGTDMLALPLVIMGGLLILGGLSSLLLPETLHKNLPETLEDGEKTGLNYLRCCNAETTKHIQNFQESGL